MEGKNCFRTRWSQQPLFSGGNIVSVVLPSPSLSPSTAAASSKADGAHDGGHRAATAAETATEALVMVCGETVNVVRVDDGELLCSYTLPVEDVILRVDAVSVLTAHQTPPHTSPAAKVVTAQSRKQSPPAEEAEAHRGAGPSGKPRKGKAASTKKESAVKTEAIEEQDGTTAAVAPELEVPLGSYIALGTRALQLYLLQLDVAVTATTKAATVDGENGEAASHVGNEEAGEHAAEADSPPSQSVVRYELKLLQSWTAAQHAISTVCFSDSGRYLLSGSTDGGVKAWNAFHHHLTHNFRCPDGTVVNVLHLDAAEAFLIAGSFEGNLTVYDFTEKAVVATARPHVQAVEAVAFGPSGTHVFSIARDRRLSVLAFSRAARTLKETRAVVVREHVSCAVFEDDTTLHIGAMDGAVVTYTVSETETVRERRRLPKPPASNAEDATEENLVRSLIVAQQPKGLRGNALLVNGFVVDDRKRGAPSSLYVADAGFNIAYVLPAAEDEKRNGGSHTPLYTVSSTLVGFLDQVLDIKVLPPTLPYSRMIVTNSKDVRLYGATGCLSKQALQGHEDIVMCCAVTSDGSLIATAGKDKEVRFWSTATWQTVGKGVRGHSGEITSICFNAKQSDSYLLLFSIAADENLRLWDAGQNVLPALQRKSTSASSGSSGVAVEFEHRGGVNAAHAGPVYALAMAPNDQYVATGGKDKLVNLWNVAGKKIYREASLKGHRRGVSSLSFSPTDRVLASASNDGTVRLWSLVSLSCVKTLQVDKTPVLQLAFFNAGTQIVTGNAEGVLRVWAVAASEAVWSAESHDEKVWALTVMETESETVFLSGAADGVLIATEDYTAEEVERLREDRHDTILREQALANAMRRGEFAEAFLLALQLSHPRHLRQVLTKWSAKDATLCEDTLRDDLLPKLEESQLLRLLQFTREWITNSRHCAVASLVTYSFLGCKHYSEIASMPSIPALVEPLLAYSQKHSQRQRDLQRRTYYIDYVLRSTAPNVLTTMPPFVTEDKGEEETEKDGAEGQPRSAKRCRVEVTPTASAAV